MRRYFVKFTSKKYRKNENGFYRSNLSANDKTDYTQEAPEGPGESKKPLHRNRVPAKMFNSRWNAI